MLSALRLVDVTTDPDLGAVRGRGVYVLREPRADGARQLVLVDRRGVPVTTVPVPPVADLDRAWDLAEDLLDHIDPPERGRATLTVLRGGLA